MSKDMARKKIKDAGLRVTPQRIAVLACLLQHMDHPGAETLINEIRNDYPDIATGTIYKILETFVEKRVISKVSTDRELMRYDPIVSHHHHIYYEDKQQITDYFDEELDTLIRNYFDRKSTDKINMIDFSIQIKARHNKN